VAISAADSSRSFCRSGGRSNDSRRFNAADRRRRFPPRASIAPLVWNSPLAADYDGWPRNLSNSLRKTSARRLVQPSRPRRSAALSTRSSPLLHSHLLPCHSLEADGGLCVTQVRLPALRASRNASVIFRLDRFRGRRARPLVRLRGIEFGIEVLARCLAASSKAGTSVRVMRLNPGPSRTRRRPVKAFPAENTQRCLELKRSGQPIAVACGTGQSRCQRAGVWIVSREASPSRGLERASIVRFR